MPSRFLRCLCACIALLALILPAAAAPATPPSEETWTQALADANAIAAREWARRPERPALLKTLAPAADPAPLIQRALAAIGSDDLAAAGEAEAALEYLGDEAFAALSAALPSARERSLQRIAFLLARRGERAVEPLAAAFRREPSADWRSVLLVALGRTESPLAIPTLIAGLQDQSPDVREQAARNLGQYQDQKAYDALAQRLPSDPDTKVCGVIAQALVAIDFPSAAPLLTRLANTSKSLAVTDENGAGNLRGAFRQLVQSRPSIFYHHPVAADLPLLQLASDARTIRSEHFPKADLDQLLAQIPLFAQNPKRKSLAYSAAAALALLRCGESAPLILRTLGRTTDSLYLLAHFPTPEAVAALAEAARGEDQSLREFTVRIMGGKEKPWLVPLLIALLDDPRLIRPAHPEDSPTGESVVQDWPATHLAHDALGYSLGGTLVNLADLDAKLPDLPAENVAIKAWWAKNRQDFIAGKPVTPPRITGLMIEID